MMPRKQSRLAAWKKKFYPIPAHEVAEADALAHSLRKWLGALPAVRKKFGLEWQVTMGRPWLYDPVSRHSFAFNVRSCALCKWYRPDSDIGCDVCPLERAVPDACHSGDNPWGRAQAGAVLPMVRALRKAMKRQK